MTRGDDVIYWWSWHQTHTRPHKHTSDEKIYDSHGLYILQYSFDPLCSQLGSYSFKRSLKITRTACSLPGTLIAYIIISTHHVSIIPHTLTTALITHFAPHLYALTLFWLLLCYDSALYWHNFYWHGENLLKLQNPPVKANCIWYAIYWLHANLTMPLQRPLPF